MTFAKHAENDYKAESCHIPAEQEKGIMDYEPLKANLIDYFKLPIEAVDWLIIIYDAFQFFDDVVDGDNIKREDFDRNLFNCLVGINLNGFYASNQDFLSPVLSQAILKWQASDKAEKEHRANVKSFIWRASYYDIVLSVVHLCKGFKFACDKSEDIMNLYDEKLTDYEREFPNA